jgi:3-hydroxybutyryl-CoA dehydrogenase
MERNDIESVGIVGAGLMGTGIAQVSALSGLSTVLVKATGSDAAAARDKLARALGSQVDRGKLSAEDMAAALERVTVTADRDALGTTQLVIESVVEDLGLKRALLTDIAGRVPETTALASNTSTLRISDLLVEGTETRTIGLHFFSPVPAMSLVELAHLPQTDSTVVDRATVFVARLGKTAVPVLDSTGFVVNRLLVPYLIGAIAAYSQGLASAERIDTAMKLGCGHPMGPLALSDLIGLDVVFAMAKLLYKDFGDSRYRPPALLRRLVQDRCLGKKTGMGFYDYSTRPARPNDTIWKLIKNAA